ncbi:MAG: class I mannose-6-phosphate isomerase [Candidatus Marinimicrobia bacterium]|nr:class I mannose-6-phosphate isomerase [Candidatus Neomarinimicrobiota bacterium]
MKAFQAPLPGNASDYPRGLYNCNPAFKINGGLIVKGYEYLADTIQDAIGRGLRVLAIDGYHGVDWNSFRQLLLKQLSSRQIETSWLPVADCHRSAAAIDRSLESFLGRDDPLFGIHYPFGPEVFFDAKKISQLRIRSSMLKDTVSGSLIIIYGSGASLIEQWDQLWYIDLPKDILQERVRYGNMSNFGSTISSSFGSFYKRSYFVDWPAQNRQKRIILPEIDLLIDLQSPTDPSAIRGSEFRQALHAISETPFRVRPWFYPGPWGGKYMQGHMGLDPEQPNFAWSFELIVPENGIVLESSGERLEFTFDFLMFQENRRILGAAAAQRFQYEWPIRLDYLDTVDGGNLSTQVHPRPDYIRQEFGETYTQDETYYIANAKPEARVYVGLTEDCDLAEFQEELDRSVRTGNTVDIDKYVNSVPVKPHDLIMIPNGTVHCSGVGNLVLEISATPYIFTFKIYDYLRKDLDGNLRPINIDRAFENIRPERRTEFVKNNYIAQPKLIRKGKDWAEYVLYERPETFYNIHRLEFSGTVDVDTDGKAYAINLVDGEQIDIITSKGIKTNLVHFESMVVPAATKTFQVINRGSSPCKLIMVYIRPDIGLTGALNTPRE